jgi:hypothetical protein
MDKREALQKIKELEEIVKSCEHPERIRHGMIFRHKSGSLYIVTVDAKLMCVVGGSSHTAGVWWSSSSNMFGSCKEQFTYMGYAKNLEVAE